MSDVNVAHNWGTVSPVRRLAGGIVGTFVEWYDFLIYGLTAPVLAVKFFPADNPATALLGVLAIYAIAFFIRPIGGLFFGYLGDRGSRIATLAATILLMGTATTLTGLLPTYQSIGVAAAILLLLCRLAQGFSAGGETSGGLSYIIESAPADKRGLWVGYGVAASFLPVVIAAVIIFALRAVVGEAAYQDWGWRIPFLLGGVLALIGLWLRRKLDDPEEFVAAVKEGPVANPIRAALRENLRAILIVVFLVAVQAVGAYLILGYLFTFLTTKVGLDDTTALLTNAGAILVMSALTPIFGAQTDRIGRKKIMFAGAAWLLITAWPAMALCSSGSVAGAFFGQLLLAVGVACFAAGGFVAMVEMFTTHVRYTGHAIAYNVGYSVFGGTTPFIAALLVARTGSALAPAYYVMAISLLGLVIVALTPETRDVRLRDAVTTEG